jgi:hypothetical protein
MTEALISRKRHHFYHTIKQRQALQNALDIKIKILRPYDQVVLSHLRSLAKNAFTKKRIKTFTELMVFLENFIQIPVADLKQFWEQEYPKITSVWGITFDQYPHDTYTNEEDYEGYYDQAEDAVEEVEKPKVTYKETKKSEDAKFDVDKRLNKRIRKEILAAGTGDKQEIKISFPAYLESTFLPFPTPYPLPPTPYP